MKLIIKLQKYWNLDFPIITKPGSIPIITKVFPLFNTKFYTKFYTKYSHYFP